MQTEIPLGEWLPDGPKPNNPGCLVADGCLPAPGGYKPMPAIKYTAQSVFGRVKGAARFFDAQENPVIVGGTDSLLFVKRGTTVTTTSGMSALGIDQFWDFAQFNGFIIATAPGNAPHMLADVNTSPTWVPLTGSPPVAWYCDRFNEFLMLGRADGVDSRLQWSHYNAPGGDWTPDDMTQAGWADLDPEFGAITAVKSGRYPLVFQERAVSLMSYVGPSTIWNVQTVSYDRGCIAPASVAVVGPIMFFLSQDGFYSTNGSDFQPIGSARVNEWFFEAANQTFVKRTQAAVDWQSGCVVWAFASTDSDGYFDRMICYSWRENRWSTLKLNVDWLVGSRVAATTLEDLDALFPTLEDVTPPLDDPFWRAGQNILAAMAPSGGRSFYALFNGPAMEANWETGSFQPSPGARVFVSEAQTSMEASEWLAQVAAIPADNQRAEAARNFSAPGVNGACPLRADGKEMRLAVRCPAGMHWRRAQGVQVTFRQSGRR